MQFPESWLRTFCNPDLSTQALADLLTMSGMEVEELRPVAPAFSGVVVGEIVSAEPHPNADRLRVCRVTAGAHGPADGLQIVCGAPNARAGIRVPLALVGAALPPGADGKPFQIKLGKLRGVESQGMLCSARELGLADDAGGLLELPLDAAVGQDIRQALNLDDTLFTLKLTPNLGHCLSVMGIAREVAALTGTPLQVMQAEPVQPGHDQVLPVRVQATDLCGRFSGRVVRGIDPAARTPAWMVERLARCGQRSVNALVDISNYVMFELGQPSHIFDLDKLTGGLTVRWGRAGEQLELLNGNTVAVDERVGVIADDAELESLAGIMGGQATAVSDATRNVYVEAAFWWPDAVAGRGRRFNFSTDAGHRFERGVDPALTVVALERITGLIQSICGGQAGPVDDQQVNVPAPTPVTLRVDRAAKVIGIPVSQAQCEEVLRRLGLPFESQPGRLLVQPPSWRFDLRIEEDLIEEVVRVIGYDTLPLHPPRAPVLPRALPEARRSSYAVRRALAARGYQETINFSFVEERWEQELAGNAAPIRLLNPIAAPLAVMRSSLLGGLVQVLRHNLARRQTRVRVFEWGRVFLRDASVQASEQAVGGINQPLRLGGLAYGAADDLQWGARERPGDFFDVKADLEALFAPLKLEAVAAEHPALHPGRCARLQVAGHDVGVLGELHPRWRQAYDLPQAPIVFEIDAEALLARPVPVAVALPRQQSVLRDLAVVAAESVTHDDIVACLRATDTGLLRDVTLFDVYRAETAQAGMAAGERSLALRIELVDDEQPLTDARSDEVVQALLASLQRTHGVRLRGA